jgi:cob(I)alamin adenosyltransferase
MDKERSRGLVQVYTGDGKGKTTAALGLSLRAAGQGMHVIFIQFLKGQQCGEHFFVNKFEPFIIFQSSEGDIFTKSDDQLLIEVNRAYDEAEKALSGGKYDIVVLDEIFIAHWRGLLSLQQILKLIENKPQSVELVMTGRKAPQEVIREADLVTEMLMIKHPFIEGTGQRKGIEY